MNFLLLTSPKQKDGLNASEAALQTALGKYGKLTTSADWFSLVNYMLVEEYTAVFICTNALEGNAEPWFKEIKRIRNFQLLVLCIQGEVLQLDLVQNMNNLLTLLKLDEMDTSLPPIMEHVQQFQDLRSELSSKLAKGYLKASGYGEFIGNSRSMLSIYRQLVKVAGSDYTVLIQGESGSGKDLVARSIHELSARQKAPYISLNCAAIPENLLESELFGYEKGAFTGANQSKAGKFELADKGTLFLDEIGDMPVTLQAKLLRVLEDNTIQPLGSVREKQVDFRLLTATHQDLLALIQRKKFREDLHYRLNVISINLPSITARDTDIYLLVLHFLGKLLGEGLSDIKSIEWALLKHLRSETIGGNVRELENLMTRLVFHTDDSVLSLTDFLAIQAQQRPAIHTEPEHVTSEDAVRPLKEVEREAIIQALLALNGNISQTATQLGISRTALYRKIDSYNLDEYLTDPGRRPGESDA